MTAPLLQRLTHTLIKPSVFDFWAGRLNPVWSWHRTLARVVERYPESADAVTLVLTPNRHFVGFEPGQHINITADVNGRRVTRSYSLTGIPRPDGKISVTVKEVAGGTLSPHLCRKTQVGDVLELGVAFGEMLLPPAQQAQKHLFLAAGSGITPLMALIRSQAAVGMPGDLTLVYWASKREAFCFVRELRELAEKYSSFRVQFVLTQQSECLLDEETGRISNELLMRCVPDLASRHVACCGTDGFVQAATELVKDTARTFQAESFSPPTFGSDATGTVQVRLAVSGRTFEVPVGESLLSALEAQGEQPEYGCRMGICNTCACGKASGTTQDMINGDISTEPVQALRLCISRATTDITLDL